PVGRPHHWRGRRNARPGHAVAGAVAAPDALARADAVGPQQLHAHLVPPAGFPSRTRPAARGGVPITKPESGTRKPQECLCLFSDFEFRIPDFLRILNFCCSSSPTLGMMSRTTLGTLPISSALYPKSARSGRDHLSLAGETPPPHARRPLAPRPVPPPRRG